jgi:uncharacterized membrane protein YadS
VSIAVSGAVRAKKEHPPIAISLVVFWAIILIFVLPLVSRTIHLPIVVGGAWIGTSEFADAAGLETFKISVQLEQYKTTS